MLGNSEYGPLFWKKEELSTVGVSAFDSHEWSPSHNLKSLRKKQLATREAMARQTVVSDTELSVVESSVIRCPASATVICNNLVITDNQEFIISCLGILLDRWHPKASLVCFGTVFDVSVHAHMTKELVSNCIAWCSVQFTCQHLLVSMIDSQCPSAP